MPHSSDGAQRASSPILRPAITAILAALVAIGALGVSAPPVEAASLKVVIVVGPVGGKTGDYKDSARRLANTARSYGASVYEVYSPYATWSRVRSVAQGANLLIYLGHGNGWPSPYGPFSVYSKDGMGLNRTAGNGNRNLKYYGEYYMRRLGLASDAVVVLNRLCYASGNSEWGSPNPTRRVAKKRVDNYGAGFLRSGARAVFASGITSVKYVVNALFTGSSSMTMTQVFWSDPARTRDYRFGFSSSRTSGARAIMDPYKPHRYYRSVIGWLGTTVGDWRRGAGT